MPATFHSLEDASTAPECVKKLVANLQRPLCGRQRLESLPSMTPLALAQLQHVHDQASDTCSTADSFDTVSDVANLVLTTTAAIKQLSGEAGGLGARSMVPHWYTLLRTIARASHSDAHITGKTPFVYPRGFGEEGIAEMLMGFAADKAVIGLNLKPERPEHSDTGATPSACADDLRALVEDHKSICESGVGESSNEDEDGDDDDTGYDEEYDHTEESYDEARDHPIYSAEPAPFDDIRAPYEFELFFRAPDEAELFFGLDAIDEHEPPEETWLDLPHWCHIFAGRHSGSVVLFPVLCVASETEIIPLMASAAYQRHAWGIDLPVVGLDISASSCSARAYISWVDPLSDVQHMPAVHIMHPKLDVAARTSDTLLLPGSFDLTNPQSSLALAHFIFSLSYQFDILQKELPSRRLRKFTWRSDEDATLWAGSIEQWRAHIDELDESSTSDASDSPSPITPKDTDTFTMPPKPPRSAASDRGRKRGQSGAVSSTTEGASATQSSGANKSSKDGSEDANTQEQADKTNQPASIARDSDVVSADGKMPQNSCSTFATRSLKELDARIPTIVNWMLYRGAFTLTRGPSSFVAALGPPEYSEMLDFYDKFTCPRWPDNWTKLDHIPRVDGCLAERRVELFNGYTKLLQQSPSNPPLKLEEYIVPLIESRLSLLLNSVDGAHTKEAKPNRALEAECRHDFDALFTNFFVADAGTPTSSEVFFEPTLRLARNTLSEYLSDTENVTKEDPYIARLRGHLNAWSKNQRDIAEKIIEDDTVILSATRPENADTLMAQCYQTDDWAKHLTRRFQAFKNKPTFRDTVRSHATMEPDTGRCDIALVTLIPIALAPDPEKAARTLDAFKGSRLFLIDYEDPSSKTTSKKVPSKDSLKRKKGSSKVDSSKAESSKKASSKKDLSKADSSKEGPPAKKTPPDPTRRPAVPLVDHPLRVPSGDYPRHNVPKTVNKPESSKDMRHFFIMLPQLLGEYKRPCDSETKALNQARLYCFSAIFYYAHMKILNYPMFGFASHGKVGVLVMGWMSSNKAAYLLERNVRRFDISEPIQAFHFACIILRLKARDRELQEKFKAVAHDYVKDLLDGNFTQWYADEPVKPAKLPSVTAAAPTPSIRASSAAASRAISLDSIPESDEH